MVIEIKQMHEDETVVERSSRSKVGDDARLLLTRGVDNH